MNTAYSTRYYVISIIVIYNNIYTTYTKYAKNITVFKFNFVYNNIINKFVYLP